MFQMGRYEFTYRFRARDFRLKMACCTASQPPSPSWGGGRKGSAKETGIGACEAVRNEHCPQGKRGKRERVRCR